jgi:hypothetical protein
MWFITFTTARDGDLFHPKGLRKTPYLAVFSLTFNDVFHTLTHLNAKYIFTGGIS